MIKKGIIYKWTCLDTGKSYIGQTVNPKQRYKCHLKSALTTNCNSPFYYDLSKYNNWTYTVLEEDIDRGEKLNERELYYITKYNTIYPNGYNLRYGASYKGITLNFSEHHKQALKESWTDERRQKASETQKVVQVNYWKTEEGKEKAKHHSKVMKDRKQTEETKQKRAESQKKYWENISDEERQNRSNCLKGKNKGKHKVWDNKELNIYHMEY